MFPIHVSHARQSTGPPSQSTGPPMNISIWGRVMCQLYIFSLTGLELKHWKEMVENPRRPIVHWHVLKVNTEQTIFDSNWFCASLVISLNEYNHLLAMEI